MNETFGLWTIYLIARVLRIRIVQGRLSYLEHANLKTAKIPETVSPCTDGVTLDCIGQHYKGLGAVNKLVKPKQDCWQH